MTPSFFAISSAYCLTRSRSVGGRVAALSVRDLVVDCSCSAGPADWRALPGTPAPAPAMVGAGAGVPGRARQPAGPAEQEQSTTRTRTDRAATRPPTERDRVKQQAEDM